MQLVSLSGAVVQALLWASAVGYSIPPNTIKAVGGDHDDLFARHPSSPRVLTTAQIRRDLGNQLSPQTIIYGPEDAQFAAATDRWTPYARPNTSIVVLPGQEKDVSKIVKYANKNSIPFLASSGRHGWTNSLSTFSGIEISLRQLNSLKIQPNKKQALIGGGAIVGDVVRPLWEKGYLAPTGGCECVGMMGAGLGGGHGRLEGYYGLISDNLKLLNVVLADGKEIKVSKTSNTDLFWAMQGAGHNFGIVTSYELNIYPRVQDTWHYHNYIWSGEHLEEVFEKLNAFHNNGSTPIQAGLTGGVMQWNETLSAPVLFWLFSWRGSAAEAEAAFAPFNAIPNLFEEQGDVPYPDLYIVQGTSLDQMPCLKGLQHTTATAGLQTYNVSVERAIFDGFAARGQVDPLLAASTVILHEGYATKGVTDIPSDSTAFPFRSDHHLMLFQGNFLIPAAGDQAAQARINASWEWAKEVQDLWNSGEPAWRTENNYVNYANGQESVQSQYGYEPWRLQRLRALKTKYDPQNRFRYYNPIVAA